MFSKIACEKDCIFQPGLVSSTCMFFPPKYDKEGNNLNPDRNILTSHVVCNTCGKKWLMQKCTHETEWEFKELADAKETN